MALKIRKDNTWATIGSKGNGSVTATASGAISAGDPVIINSNATVSKVAETSNALPIPGIGGDAADFTTHINNNDRRFRGARIAYVPDGDYYIICFVSDVNGDANKDFLRARAATVTSSGVITYGPEYKVESGSTSYSYTTGNDCDEFTLVYDPDIKNYQSWDGKYYQNHDAVLVFYKGSSNRSYTRYVWSTDGTSLSFGSSVEVTNYNARALAIAYNKGIKKFMIAYANWDNNPYKLEVRLGTPSTNLIGGRVDFSSATEISSGIKGVSIVTDKTSGFIVMCNESTGSGTRRALYGIDVDGTTLDVGSATYLSEASNHGWIDVDPWVNLCVFHEEKGKFVYIFHGKKIGTNATEPPDILIAVLTLSGNSISYSAQYTVYEGSYGSLKNLASLVYDPYLKEVYAHWSPTNNGGLIINKITIDAVPTEDYWTNTITHPDGGEVTVYDHTVDSEGNIFVCGGIKMANNNPTNAIEGFIYKISSSGNLIKSIQHDPLSAYGTQAQFSGIVSDSLGDVYAHAGNGICCKYNSDLDLQWSTRTSWNGTSAISNNELLTNGCMQLVSDSTIRIAGGGGTGTSKFDISTSNGTVISGYNSTVNGGGTANVVWNGASVTGGDMYLCGSTYSPTGTGSDRYWVINGGAGFTNSYRFYNSGTDCRARCIVKDTVNNRTYIGGRMQVDQTAYGMITRVDNYNTTTLNQGTIWWRRGDTTTHIMDMALDSLGDLYVIQSNGTLLKINPTDGSLIFAKTLSGSLSKITIDSKDNIWINSDGSGGEITIYKLSTDGNGLSNNTSSTLTSWNDYQHQDYGRIQYATMGGSSTGSGLQSPTDSGSTSTITPSSSKSEISPVPIVIGPKTTYFDDNVSSYTLLEAVGGQGQVESGMTGFAGPGKTHHLFVFKNGNANNSPGGAKAVKIQNTTTNLTESNFLGFSESTYTNNATAKINIIGSINTNQSGLTVGEKYYVQSDAGISTTAGDPKVEGGVALSATNLLINGDTGVLNSIEGTTVPPFMHQWRIPLG